MIPFNHERHQSNPESAVALGRCRDDPKWPGGDRWRYSPEKSTTSRAELRCRGILSSAFAAEQVG